MKHITRPLGWMLILALLAAWEGIARSGLVEQVFFPPVSRILVTFARLLLSGVLPYHIGASLINMFAGYFLSVLVTVPFGILLGTSRPLYNLFEPIIEFLRPLPTTAIVPAAMLFLGIGSLEKIFLIFFACSKLMIVNTIYGARGTDPLLIETARTYGYRRLQVIRRIILPAASPSIMTGLRISLAISIILIIAVEMLGSDKGIGYYTILMQRSFSTTEMYAGVFALCILGYLLNRLFRLTEGRLMAWHAGATAKQR
ncbi:MAG: ABC transporter permease [Candidatus Tectomicrobia bacterium]|nr:ABC transporter permease [Candidatus Tectomicrobia bacterium]